MTGDSKINPAHTLGHKNSYTNTVSASGKIKNLLVLRLSEQKKTLLLLILGLFIESGFAGSSSAGWESRSV